MRTALIAVLCCLSAAHSVMAASFFDQFIGPEDKAVDAGRFLLESREFLPLPLIITRHGYVSLGLPVGSPLRDSLNRAAARG